VQIKDYLHTIDLPAHPNNLCKSIVLHVAHKQPPAVALSSAVLMRVFGNPLFERKRVSDCRSWWRATQ